MENTKKRAREPEEEMPKQQPSKRLRVLSDVSDSSDDDLGLSQSQQSPAQAARHDPALKDGAESDSSLDSLDFERAEDPSGKNTNGKDSDSDEDKVTAGKEAPKADARGVQAGSDDSDVDALSNDSKKERKKSFAKGNIPPKKRKEKTVPTKKSEKRQQGCAKVKASGKKKKSAADSDVSSLSEADETPEDKENQKAKKRSTSKKHADNSPPKKKIKAEKKETQDGYDDSDDEPASSSKNQKDKKDPASFRLKKLKRCAREAGLGVTYWKVLQGVDSDKKKVRILKDWIVDKGVPEPITIEKCREFKLKREQEAELKELEKNEILEAEEVPEGRRVTRSIRKTPSRPSRVQIESSDEEEEGIPLTGLEGIVCADSD
ncbi:HIRA interacting protein 3-like protein [Aphelenchoides avenae]|nr:HIRA interacting protein 3-like protein [Aphelenchus avenae]